MYVHAENAMCLSYDSDNPVSLGVYLSHFEYANQQVKHILQSI